MTTITALPSPPSRQDPTNFNDRADAFLGALPAFATEVNAVASETNTASANAVAANQAVIAATNITKWVSGTTYAEGAVVWSPINGLAYRRITASGSGTTDPSLDSTNYKQVNGTGDVSTSGNQTIAGVKTFSTPIAVGSGGTGASTAAVAFDNLKQAATESYAGVIELATSQEAYDGTAQLVAITPATLRNAMNATNPPPMFTARAWVNFNGTGTVSIRSSGNVSSITDNGTGDYTVNFSTSLPDANYAWTGTARNPAGNDTSRTCLDQRTTTTKTASALAVRVMSGGTSASVSDSDDVNVAIFR